MSLGANADVNIVSSKASNAYWLFDYAPNNCKE